MTNAESEAMGNAPQRTYVSAGNTVASWLLTRDHKRIAILYLISIMVFFALCMQCGSTVATIKREANSWRWAAFAFGYMTALAYLASLAVYQIGRLLA